MASSNRYLLPMLRSGFHRLRDSGRRNFSRFSSAGEMPGHRQFAELRVERGEFHSMPRLKETLNGDSSQFRGYDLFRRKSCAQAS